MYDTLQRKVFIQTTDQINKQQGLFSGLKNIVSWLELIYEWPNCIFLKQIKKKKKMAYGTVLSFWWVQHHPGNWIKPLSTVYFWSTAQGIAGPSIHEATPSLHHY